MTTVIIQPARGKAEGRRNWKLTLDQEVGFGTPARRSVLTSEQRAGLAVLHPEGRARFWGTTSNNDRYMAGLRAGDVVLFTGQGQVAGVGEVGYAFRNAEFADTLWAPNPEKGSYQNVYSLLSFQPTAIPYQEIRELLDLNENDVFRSLRVLKEEKSGAVIAGLRIETKTATKEALRRERELETGVAVGAGTLVPEEAMNVVLTMYERIAGTVLVHRAEAELVARYRESLRDGKPKGRLWLAGKFTDLHVCLQDGGNEIVEAKRDSTHEMVRQALGQLLDYGPHCPRPVARLTALFPSRPGDDGVELLHRYGIDCVYERDRGSFDREPAPDRQRERMMPIWVPESAAAAPS